MIILILLLLSSCAAQVQQKLNPQVYYRKDITFQIKIKDKTDLKRFQNVKYRKKIFKKDIVEFQGVVVLPFEETYKVKVISFGKMDFFRMTSCHEEFLSNDRDKGIFNKNGETTFEYTPTIERKMACPLAISTYNKKQNHGWGLLVFENPKYKLKAKLSCNGYVMQASGVSICQSKKGLMQRIEFNEKVMRVKPIAGQADRKEICPVLQSDDDKTFTFLIPPRECIYAFISYKTNQIHKLYTIGYEAIIVR